ncbi:MAG: MBL fold metallo-hydrolase [Desulfosudaceae bacterium]
MDKKPAYASIRSGPDQGICLCVLASGSRGNATYISDGETSLLIDAGLSGVEIKRRLAVRGISPDDLNAIVVSHEHNDHIQGVGVLARRYDLPVYISRATAAAAMKQLKTIGEYRYFECGREFSINQLTVHPFSLSHDAADPAGFTISRQELKIGLATDLGVATAMVRSRLRKCDILVVEANHDPDMLLGGTYPWAVKQRIKGRTGHLSNQDSRALLAEIKHDRLAHVVLAHLSQDNNTCEKALAMAGTALNNSGASLSVALQDRCGEMLRIGTDDLK